MQVRELKLRLWSRRFVCVRGRVHGLSYGDQRSHTKRRHVPRGRLALCELPVDDYHTEILRHKKVQRQDTAKWKKTVRALRHNYEFASRMSFSDWLRFYEKKIYRLDPEAQQLALDKAEMKFKGATNAVQSV